MKAYALETKFSFGKHFGKTVGEVLKENPTYLIWCLINLDHFLIMNEDLEAMINANPVFVLTPEAEEIRCAKLKEFQNQRTGSDNNGPVSFGSRKWSHEDLADGDWDYDYNNPAHDPDENPWIDVFGPGDEAETAYWNTE